MSKVSNNSKQHKRSDRLLVVVFDALRPDMVSEQTMPNLNSFARNGVRFERSRSVFPTETRVNQAAFVTGCWPARHNIVGNKFVELLASPQKVFNTGDEDALKRGDQLLDGALLGSPSLGELLHTQGETLAVISAGTPGGGRLLHHRAETTGGMRLALARPDACYPVSVADDISARIGAIPAPTIPSLEWLSWTTDAWIEYVEPTLRPTVSVLWFCEPDNSYHNTGIGSPDNLAALRHADIQFARLLDVAEREGLNVISCSDHGQLAVVGDALNLKAQAAEAGFQVAEVPREAGEIGFALDSAGGIFVHEHDQRIIERLVQWLGDMSWCHSVSTRNAIGGSLAHRDLYFDSVRAPDVGLSLHNDEQPGPYGFTGNSYHDASYPVGGGIHGGLNPIELANWLACAGPAFAQQTVHETTVGIVDLLPTILALLKLPASPTDGRVLHEAFVDGAGAPTERTIHRDFRVGDRVRRLSMAEAGGRRYLHGIRAV